MDAAPSPDPRGQKRGRSAGSGDQPPPAPGVRGDFAAMPTVVPGHWRALPVHDPRHVWYVDTPTIDYYFTERERLGEGAYGKVYRVNVNHANSVPAFAGLDRSSDYALKMISYDLSHGHESHPDTVAELEMSIAMLRLGVDMTHFVPLCAWTRWYIGPHDATSEQHRVFAEDDDSQLGMPHLYQLSDVAVQLMLYPTVRGPMLADLYRMSRIARPGALPIGAPTSRPSDALAQVAPAAGPAARCVYAGAAVAAQLMCALHLLRANGLSGFMHMDLHAQNVMCGPPAGIETMLIYRFDRPGMQGLVVPLALTLGRVLRIIDMGKSKASYTHSTATGGTERHIVDVRTSRWASSTDLQHIVSVVRHELIRGETADVQGDVRGNLASTELMEVSDALHLDEPYTASPTFYSDLLASQELFAPFRFVDEAGLAARLAELQTLLRGPDDTSLTSEYGHGRYRVVTMPRAGMPEPVLPAAIERRIAACVLAPIGNQ